MSEGAAHPDALTTAYAERGERQLPGLTPRERQVVELVAMGASNKDIALELAIAERTVKAHLTSVFQKLGLSSRLQLAVFALSRPDVTP